MQDIIIIGGGPAGMYAGAYAVRYGLKTMIIAEEFGGMMNMAHVVDNYLAFKGSGTQLAEKMKEQCKALGVKIVQDVVNSAKKTGKTFSVMTGKGKTYESKAIIVVTGSKRKKLGIKGEDEFLGKGVNYCVLCDAPFYKNKTVAVVGGGNSSARAVQILTEIAKKIYWVYRKTKDKMKANPALVKELEKNPKVEFIFNANVTELKGDKFLRKAVLDTGKELDVEGMFIEIGAVPTSVLAKGLGIKTDKMGYVLVDEDQKTNADLVYAAGDLTAPAHKMRQIVTSAAEGAKAAHSAYIALKEKGLLGK